MRADRLLAIMLRLHMEKHITTSELARELGVSRRTILRDLDALSAAGVPVYTQSGQGGGVALDESYRISLTGLREAEIRALYLSGNAKLLADIGLDKASQNVLLKFFATLPALQQQLVRQVRERIYIDPTWWVRDETPPLPSDLLQALEQNRQLEVSYQHANGDVVKRLLEPYGLVAKGGAWYLVAKRDDVFRIYRGSRFHHIISLEERFERDESFDLQAFWHTHIQQFIESLLPYCFTLRIHNRQTDFIRRYSTGHYEIVQAADEQGWFTAHFRAESIRPAIMLIFGLGTDAVIVEPQELLDAIHSQCRLFSRSVT
jgi:predicted DNA-binding transcriptional regulator YafY